MHSRERRYTFLFKIIQIAWLSNTLLPLILACMLDQFNGGEVVITDIEFYCFHAWIRTQRTKDTPVCPAANEKT